MALQKRQGRRPLQRSILKRDRCSVTVITYLVYTQWQQNMAKQPSRPAINRVKTADELRRWYWLKSELVSFARQNDIARNCDKPELLARICHWLDTGEKLRSAPARVTSTFDWSKEQLTRSTIITDNYRNTQNVRRFM